MNENVSFQLKDESGDVFKPDDVSFVLYSQVLNILYVKLKNNFSETVQIGVPKRKKSILQEWLDYHNIYYPPEDFL
ncbi:hypothetical protein ABID42_004131 [Arcicella rosea]